MSEHVFIVDYAYGFHANTCEVDYVCKLRCQAALRAYKKYPHARIVLGAGMKEVTGDCGSLASMMHDLLVDHGVPPSAILRNPYGNNTLNETEAAYQIICDRGGAAARQGARIICATSAYHAPRVWAIWACRFGIMPEIYTTALRPSVSERLSECIKIPRDMIRALLHRV